MGVVRCSNISPNGRLTSPTQTFSTGTTSNFRASRQPVPYSPSFLVWQFSETQLHRSHGRTVYLTGNKRERGRYDARSHTDPNSRRVSHPYFPGRSGGFSTLARIVPFRPAPSKLVDYSLYTTLCLSQASGAYLYLAVGAILHSVAVPVPV